MAWVRLVRDDLSAQRYRRTDAVGLGDVRVPAACYLDGHEQQRGPSHHSGDEYREASHRHQIVADREVLR